MAEHHVREYVKRVASVDLENYPEWDLTVGENFECFTYDIYNTVIMVI